MEAEDYHWLPCTPMIARPLLVEEGVKYHISCPVIVGVVMEERRHQIAGTNSTRLAGGIIKRDTLEDPRQHQSDVHASKETELR